MLINNCSWFGMKIRLISILTIVLISLYPSFTYPVEIEYPDWSNTLGGISITDSKKLVYITGFGSGKYTSTAYSVAKVKIRSKRNIVLLNLIVAQVKDAFHMSRIYSNRSEAHSILKKLKKQSLTTNYTHLHKIESFITKQYNTDDFECYLKMGMSYNRFKSLREKLFSRIENSSVFTYKELKLFNYIRKNIIEIENMNDYSLKLKWINAYDVGF